MTQLLRWSASLKVVKKTARVSSRTSPKLPNSDDDGNQIHNEILLSLPRAECDLVFSGWNSCG
jgi:hypothetical protein